MVDLILRRRTRLVMSDTLEFKSYQELKDWLTDKPSA